MDPVILIALVVLFLPLAAFAVQVGVGYFMPRQGDWIPTGAMFLGWVLSLYLFFGRVLAEPGGMPTLYQPWTWFSVGGIDFGAGILVDNLTVLMLVVVTTVSFLVHLYSCGYMRDHHGNPEAHYSRFFAYLALFSFSMLLLVLTENLFVLYVSWELVGVCSYFLIGFYFHKPSAAHAAMKAFITTRVGDVGFFLAVMIILGKLGKLDYYSLFKSVEAGEWDPTLLAVTGVLLFFGAIGKSAQFPLHVWLPDAMEGPTPVSALIHAATMVAAGVYMAGRLFPFFAGEAYFAGDFFSSPTLWFIAGIGAVTAILAATMAIVQTDIKKVLAYSTVSQLGYMMLGIGVGSFAAGLYHLFTHAFFKACLFLCSGSVIHALGTNEMPEMGGLRRKLPITFWTFLVSTAAISGVPFFSGFWSKEAIVTTAFAFGIYQGTFFSYLPFAIAILTAGVTAFYMFRAVFLTFTGEPRNLHRYEHARESPPVMTVPLLALAFGAIVAGGVLPSAAGWFANKVGPEITVAQFMAVREGRSFVPPAPEPEHAFAPGLFGGVAFAEEGPHGVPGGPQGGGAAHSSSRASVFQQRFKEAEHEAHYPVLFMSLLVAASGILVSWLVFAGPYAGVDLVGKTGPLAALKTLFENLYFIDWFYYKVVVGGTLAIRHALGVFDSVVIDGLVNFWGRTGVVLAKISGVLDYWGVDGAVRGTADGVLRAGDEARRVQTGRLQDYVYLSLIIVAFIFLVWIVAGTLA